MTEESTLEKPQVEPPFEEIPEDELVAEDDSVIGRAFRWSLVAIVGIAIIVVATVYIVRRPAEKAPPQETRMAVPTITKTEVQPPKIVFTDITKQSGIDFVHFNGASGEKLMPETLGGGCAFFDYDGDDDQDILFVNSNHWPEAKADSLPTMALYSNDGSGKFKNVTKATGLDVSFYGMGNAVGDFDNDGDTDIFFTAVGPNRLFRNDGGKFSDITAAAGVAGDQNEWSTSAGFFDYDNDGDLDLFVCNYIQWSKQIDFEVDYRLVGVGRAYGPPMNFSGTFPYLYRNNGDGTFTDVSAQSGIQITNTATGAPMAKALAIAPVDADGDGWIDLLVANDTVANFFYHNNGDGTFTENGALYGVAYDRQGAATGAMGIDGGHFRNDDAIGFFIGNFANEMTSVYVSQGDASIFADEAISEGIGAPSRLMLTFGLFLFDYDLDGRLDLLQTNGHLEEEINLVQSSQHYEQPPQLFWNCGPQHRQCFVPVSLNDVGDLSRPIVGRGAAFADIDADGDLDALLTQVGREPMLLRNDQKTSNRWIRLTLVGKKSNRDAIGAWVSATIASGSEQQPTTLRRQVMPTRSYLSQVEKPVTIGLADGSVLKNLKITWPDGQTEDLAPLAPNRSYTIIQGQGPASES